MDGCASYQNTVTRVYGSDHASIATPPDGPQDYMASHAQTTPNPKSDIYRTTRIKKFTRNNEGTPKLPLGKNVSPDSGEPASLSGTLVIVDGG
ncbi:hypothetical protein DL766_005507 [Monosporascus sp. MC13-8B]|uniref:Uncharacterized protein n=1 Tax=Monosporascus cannonballus TaxID=155416 RepID=A0ABY0HKD3_9PEZI|nr:hypothetical protein DL762_000184 [Monosporascus cannonballus]RYP01455.1 hypothetical protein DL763_000118 [Monosporascus cannonballus]RYP29154.1 hypothetical protein DL766_005507 [Monosporascus sp. MC13-8B]